MAISTASENALSRLHKITFVLAILFSPENAVAEWLWKSMPPTPTPRTEASVVIVDDWIFIIGGFTPIGITDKVEAMDLKTGSWTTRSSLPLPLHHSTASAVNGKIYVIGGFENSLWNPVAHTFEYEPKTDRWTRKKTMPTPRGALASAVINGKIHLIGGAYKQFFRLINTSAHESYDPKSDSWKPLPPLPTKRDHLAAVAVDGFLYAIGGRLNVNYKHNLFINEAYNSKTRKWIRKADMPTARSGISAQTLNGVIFVFGGESDKKTFRKNEAYSPKTNNWQTMKPMLSGRHGLGSAVYRNTIHLLTGGPNPGGSGSNLHETFYFTNQGE